MGVGENIKFFRKQKGLTQKELGEIIHMSPNSIQRYELGHRDPQNKTLEEIAKALGVSMADLLGIENHKQAMKNLAKRLNAMSEEERKEISDKKIKEWEDEKIKSIQDAILTIAESADCIDFFLNEDITMNYEKSKRMFDIFVNTMKLLIDNADKK